jgi:hypothetical protein
MPKREQVTHCNRLHPKKKCPTVMAKIKLSINWLKRVEIELLK